MTFFNEAQQTFSPARKNFCNATSTLPLCNLACTYNLILEVLCIKHATERNFFFLNSVTTNIVFNAFYNYKNQCV